MISIVVRYVVTSRLDEPCLISTPQPPTRLLRMEVGRIVLPRCSSQSPKFHSAISFFVALAFLFWHDTSKAAKSVLAVIVIVVAVLLVILLVVDYLEVDGPNGESLLGLLIARLKTKLSAACSFVTRLGARGEEDSEDIASMTSTTALPTTSNPARSP